MSLEEGLRGLDLPGHGALQLGQGILDLLAAVLHRFGSSAEKWWESAEGIGGGREHTGSSLCSATAWACSAMRALRLPMECAAAATWYGSKEAEHKK